MHKHQVYLGTLALVVMAVKLVDDPPSPALSLSLFFPLPLLHLQGLRIKLRASYLPGKYSIAELNPHCGWLFLNIFFVFWTSSKWGWIIFHLWHFSSLMLTLILFILHVSPWGFSASPFFGWEDWERFSCTIQDACAGVSLAYLHGPAGWPSTWSWILSRCFSFHIGFEF